MQIAHAAGAAVHHDLAQRALRRGPPAGTVHGQTYFVDPRGQLVGEAAGDKGDEVIVRDLDLGKLTEVRDLWQFYRDRRPDSYESLVNP